MLKQIVDERRHWVRSKRILSIEYRLVKRVGKRMSGPWLLSTTQDMSIGGVAFFSDQEFHIGDVLELRVSMSGILDVIKGLAKVVRIEKKTMGAFYLIAVKMLSMDSKGRISRIKSSLRVGRRRI